MTTSTVPASNAMRSDMQNKTLQELVTLFVEIDPISDSRTIDILSTLRDKCSNNETAYNYICDFMLEHKQQVDLVKSYSATQKKFYTAITQLQSETICSQDHVRKLSELLDANKELTDTRGYHYYDYDERKRTLLLILQTLIDANFATRELA